ncbi:MAG: BatA and WFA domain-containing protein [Lentisphaerae bacterium]|nr:BatA and WFA domain-containing protein [Lentisphaerota bacterium]
MLSFLNPWFLAAAAAAVAPLILHMIQSRKTVRMPFSTIRFLKLAEKQSSHRVRMEQFLLWFLRTLLLLLLALAFAMPVLRADGWGGFLGRSRRDVAVVLDRSLSMRYRVGGTTVWKRALEAAGAVIEGLGPQDRFCIFAAGEGVEPVMERLSGDKETAAERLRALEPGVAGSDLCAAAAAAAAALEQGERGREREIHIITDNQARAWDGFARAAEQGGAAAAWDPAEFGDRTAFFVTLLGAPDPENTAPADAVTAPAVVMAETPSQVTVRLAHSGPPADTAVTLYVNGREAGRRAARTDAAGRDGITLAVPPLAAGVHTARVETPADNLPDDNAFYFLLRAREALPVLCVGGADETRFLRTALRTGGPEGAAIAVRRIDADALGAETLSAYDTIFLCNALPLPGEIIAQLEQAVRAGALLAVFPGDRAGPDAYAPWTCLPGTPSAVRDVPPPARKQALYWEQPDHPLLRGLRRGGLPSLTLRRRLAWETFRDGAEVLVRAGPVYPFLVVAPCGRGRMLTAAVSADRLWSDFPLSPYYLPLLQRIVEFGAGVGTAPPYLETAASLALNEHLPEAAHDSVLRGPDGRQIPIRGTVAEGRTVLTAEGLTAPGIYTLAGPDRPDPAPALALNAPRAESDLTPLEPAAVLRLLGVSRLVLADSLEALRKRIEEHRVGRTFAEPLLWLALFLAVLEFCYANILLRPGPTLSDTLRVEASGKVRSRREVGREAPA